MTTPIYIFGAAVLMLAIQSCGGANANANNLLNERGDPSLTEVWSQMTNSPDWTMHDPSRIIRDNNSLMVAVTGKEQSNGYNCGLETWVLDADEQQWMPGECLLQNKPNWIAEELPLNDGAYWAPEFLTSTMLYYSVSNMNADNEGSCIGLAIATGDGSQKEWKDIGRPILCTFDSETSFSAKPASIDPSVFVDDDGRAYLVFGGGHIYAAEIDRSSGLLKEDEWWSEFTGNYVHLADPPSVDEFGYESEEEWIEAAYLIKRNGYYYLLVNWYACCNGADSSYEIRMGRTTDLSKPFIDKQGKSLLEGGGSLLLDSDDLQIGPGHAGIYQTVVDNEIIDIISYHYYTVDSDPWATIATRELLWCNGWPQAGDIVEAPALIELLDY